MRLPLSKQVCADCHFFVRTHHPSGGQGHIFEVDPKRREKTRQGDFTWQHPGEAVSCYKGIWDEGVGFPVNPKPNTINDTRRNGACYFLKYRPGTLLPAAEKLQELQVARQSEAAKYRLAVYGILIAGLALLAKLVLGL